jgi:hypothetical protein
MVVVAAVTGDAAEGAASRSRTPCLQTALNQAGAGPCAPACLRAPVSSACPRAQFSSTGARGGTQVSGERGLPSAPGPHCSRLLSRKERLWPHTRTPAASERTLLEAWGQISPPITLPHRTPYRDSAA